MDESSTAILLASLSGIVTNVEDSSPDVYEEDRLEPVIVSLTINSFGGSLRVQVIAKAVKEIPLEYRMLTKKFFYIQMSSSGYQTKDTLDVFCRVVVFPGIVEERLDSLGGVDDGEERSILHIDGHPSRINPDLWSYAWSLRIDVLCFPAHSSTVLQPCDRGVNAEFKV
ncbi:MAG: hypothetical protein EZS28_021880 [Streblomastix strix]|uniref:DDE-1 domain-containing protein n=1 Tax=Streblomastix strix TaxID=222440 RepID=A0A5J4VJ29_9EUKA|nr:MAG: hypothetical protein EZS28_021880 [Streblomastix strix]